MDEKNEITSLAGEYTNTVISEIKTLLDTSRQNVATHVNQALISTY